jgi:thiamine biosynthesis lipoprotein
METTTFRAMNTEILLAAEGESEQVAEGFERTRQYIQAGESRFSRFLEESELSQLNRANGTWFQASSDLFSVVGLAQQLFHQTRGLFDPSILPDLRKSGYDRSMDLLRTQGAGPLLESILAGERPSFGAMELDELQQKILLLPGMTIDLGGIAKGWLAEQAATLLSASASACAVSAGGDMYLVGLPAGQEHWPVALEDPLDAETTLTTLQVDPGAVATSAVTKRTWKQGEVQRHHLIDPRTGHPAVTEWLSVTVIAPHADEAEVYAKALLIAGPGQAEQIAATSPSPISYLAVDRKKKIWGTNKSLEYVHVNGKPSPAYS